MSNNSDELKKLLEADQLQRTENNKKHLIEMLQLKMRLMPLASSQQSEKDKEKEIKKMLTACARCGDNHLGGCMKPPQSK